MKPLKLGYKFVMPPRVKLNSRKNWFKKNLPGWNNFLVLTSSSIRAFMIHNSENSIKMCFFNHCWARCFHHNDVMHQLEINRPQLVYSIYAYCVPWLVGTLLQFTSQYGSLVDSHSMNTSWWAHEWCCCSATFSALYLKLCERNHCCDQRLIRWPVQYVQASKSNLLICLLNLC